MRIHSPHFFQSFQVVLDRVGHRFLCWLLAALLGLSTVSSFAETEENAEPVPVAIVVSLVRQYLEAVEGLSRVMEAKGVEIEVFTLEDYPERRRAVLREKMAQRPFECYIGVGEEAARFIWRELEGPNATALYTIVLNPEKNLPPTRDLCGISLNISIAIQVQKISAALPGSRRIGLLYDPLNNDPFFIQANQIAGTYGRQIVPLKVSSSKEIPGVLEKQLTDIDALWLIPDRTVGFSESIIQFIIETAFLGRVPVIGYTNFTYESGAALSFIFDYEELGEQTGQLAIEVLQSGVCRSPDPRFSMQVNRKVIERLDIQLGEEVLEEATTQP